MIDARTRRSNGHKPDTGPTWLDRRREHLRQWLPPILHDVLGVPPSREFLRWLWGRPYDLASLTPGENWLIMHAVVIGDIGECEPGELRRRLASGLSGGNEVAARAGNIVCRAIDAMERRPGYIRPKDMADTEFEVLITWLESGPL